MVRCPLLYICLVSISLNICVTSTHLGKDRNDLFRISTREVSKEDPEPVASLGDEIIRQEDPKSCKSNSDCFHGGTCNKNGTCLCPLGTNGTLCENAVECIKHPDMCGKGTDVKCVFNDKFKYAMCQCDDEKKWFNDFSGRCAIPCKDLEKNGTKRADCGIYGRCMQSFCVCVNGTSGDRCEIIDQCKELDCEKDPSATCSLGIDGAYCRCKKPYQVFDEKEKVCKGEPCTKSTDCMYGGNCTADGTCLCPDGTTGPLCQDVRECIRNPKMCGNGSDVKCIFSVFDQEATCSCDAKKKWFNSFTKKCAEPCRKYINHQYVEEDCGQYGRCSTNSFCVCVKGTSGDRCEIINQCASGKVDCSNDPSATCSLGIEGAYCKCSKVYQEFDTKEKLCTGEPCKTDSDCKHGGNCTDDGTCVCPKGLLGPLCQRVYECEEKPDMCGNGTDVKCDFDVEMEKARCFCDDEEKEFDDIEKKCRKVCEHDKDCGLYGTCDRYSFCRCIEGVSGDNCEIIEKCRTMDCGIRTNCTLGSDGEAHCKCQDPHLGFDYESKTCKACECGDNSKGCEFRDGEKKCECAINYFHKGDKCEACNCGELSKGCELKDGKKECFCPLNYTTIGDTCQKCNCGTGSYHCRMEDGNTKCVCYEPYKQRKDKCEFCDCGVHSGNCSFTDSGEKQCECRPGFKMAKETGFCTEMCDNTSPCQNGGQCQEGLCKCHEDYAGAWCETPKWCMHSRCENSKDEVECIWDREKRAGRCECKKAKTFYIEEDRSCKECDCGENGRCILMDGNVKLCICDKGYADYLFQCKRCDCGAFSTNCTFERLGEKHCHCINGHKQTNSKSLSGEDLSTCAYCNCGAHGICRFIEGKKECDCEENHKEYDGVCKECSCGPYGFCHLDSYGDKVCTCDFGYSVLEGRCESCDCEPPGIRGIGTVCLFEGTQKECHCPRGYQSPKNDTCEDINECLNKDACPANADCFNQPGSYRCQCKKGFKTVNTGLDPKKLGCEDINECAQHPCTGPNTVCVNTPGSYDCQCLDGYYPTSSTSGRYYNPKYATCNKEETQWRSASIALGVILSVGIIAVGSYVFYQRKRYSR